MTILSPKRPLRRHRLLSLVGFLLAFGALVTQAAAQNQLWARQIGTNNGDYARGAATDGSGGVYVGGDTYGSIGGPYSGQQDVYLARYDGAGNQLWARQLGGINDDWTGDVTEDGSGGIYWSGDTSNNLGWPPAGPIDCWLARYDSAGSQLWIRQFGTSSIDLVHTAEADGAGGVFLAGTTEGSLGGQNSGDRDAWLARYDGAGNQLWILQLGTSLYDSADAAAADGSGGVIVCGTTAGSLGGPNAGGHDAWLARYDGAGNQLWIRQLGTSGGDGLAPGYNYGSPSCADGSGGVYLGGATDGSLGAPNAGGHDSWLARYDGAGNQLWVRQLGTSGFDIACGAATDEAGGVYVNGSTAGSLGGPSAGGSDVWLARYDGAGSQLWVLQSGTSADDYAKAAAADGLGGVYVNGDTWGGLGGPHVGVQDAWLARYDGGLTMASDCTPAAVNSTGQPAVLEATGTSAIWLNDVTLAATQMPVSQFGFFLNSLTQGFTPNPGGSQGDLCLGGAIGRYNPAAGYPVQNSGTLGSIQVTLDLGNTPTPSGFTSITAGQTWNFQAWYRDNNPGPTSNFTDALSITFL